MLGYKAVAISDGLTSNMVKYPFTSAKEHANVRSINIVNHGSK